MSAVVRKMSVSDYLVPDLYLDTVYRYTDKEADQERLGYRNE